MTRLMHMPARASLRPATTVAINNQVSATLLCVHCLNTKVYSKHETIARAVMETKLYRMHLSIRSQLSSIIQHTASVLCNHPQSSHIHFWKPSSPHHHVRTQQL